MLRQRSSKLLPAVVRQISTTSKDCRSHYDVLGVTPKATQNDIKSAYYKLSKIYHPDRSSDEDSAKKFRAITEAYEVLGNVSLKRMYDRGLLVGKENTTRMDYQPEPEPTDPTLKFYKSRTHSNVTPTMDGTRPIYDFDSWSKQHYGDLFQKQKYDRQMNKIKWEKREHMQQDINQETFIYLLLLLTGVIFMVISGATSDYDVDKTKVTDVGKKSN
ncbi:dnaJ homolog subfamily C member 30, mitochondrial [Manduca sexta]|uniref:J domain-containing protein n=1 Tax=Manduca sexta TaxID=7130 RepID=A0A921YPF9_MANSE|nr:dnaJ homolog subfamily C member 30, mitochondrial [Manduca sexta]KAG6442995.1 hypothetical protein O3G_MSEX002616 [Manduca sexta]